MVDEKLHVVVTGNYDRRLEEAMKALNSSGRIENLCIDEEPVPDEENLAMPHPEENEASQPRKMLTVEEVLQLVPVKRTSLYRMEKQGLFPASTYIMPNRRVWFADEVAAWQASVDFKKSGRARGPGRPKGK